MTTPVQENLARLLLEMNDLDDSAPISDLLDSASTGTTHGANHFVENGGQSIQPADLKSYLRCYPMAQAMVAIMKHYDLNRDTEVIRNTVEVLLDMLEEQDRNETLH